MNAVAFPILADGIPIVYQGQEQHFSGGKVPYNREALWTSGYNTSSVLYQYISTLNSIRSWAISYNSNYLGYNAWPIYSDTQTIAMRKGFAGNQVVAVYTNAGSSGATYSLSFPSSNTGFSNSQSVIELLTCTTYTTNSTGYLNFAMTNGLPMVFYPASAQTGSGICSTTSGKQLI